MSRLERFLLYGGLVLAGVLIFRMMGQYEGLAGQHSDLRDRLRTPQPGYSVPTFTNRTIDGVPITLGEREDGRQLVFFFTTTCEFCLASLPAWREIAVTSEREHAEVEVVGVALDADGPVAEYRDRHGLAFPITTFPQQKLAHLYRAGSVPLVALLDETGRVLYARLGVLEQRAAIDSVLTAIGQPSPVERAPEREEGQGRDGEVAASG